MLLQDCVPLLCASGFYQTGTSLLVCCVKGGSCMSCRASCRGDHSQGYGSQTCALQVMCLQRSGQFWGLSTAKPCVTLHVQALRDLGACLRVSAGTSVRTRRGCRGLKAEPTTLQGPKA